MVALPLGREYLLFSLWSTLVIEFGFLPLLFAATCHRLQQDEQFDAYVKTKQRESNAQLETLLWKPMERVGSYHALLVTAISMIPTDHKDTAALKVALTEWEALHKDTDRLISERQNEQRLVNIELSFPYEDLMLIPQATDDNDVPYSGSAADSPGGGGAATPTPVKSPKRRWSLASVIKRVTPESRKYAYKGAMADAQGAAELKCAEAEYRDYAAYQETARTSAHKRQFVGEGGVVVGRKGGKAGEADKTRTHLFLFSDLLLVARAKSSGSYVLRDRIILSEAWVGPSRPELASGFYLGAPHCRSLLVQGVASGSKRSLKVWQRDIAAAIQQAKAPNTAMRSATVYPFVPEKSQSASNSSRPMFVNVDVRATDTMDVLILAVLKELNVADPEVSKFVLYEVSEFGVERCQNHACPAIILAAGGRIAIHRSRCHFVLRHADASDLRVDQLPPNLQSLVTSPPKKSPRRSLGGGRWPFGQKSKSFLPGSAKKKRFSRSKSDGAHGGKAGSGSKLPAYIPPVNAASRRGAGTGTLFGRPLSGLMEDGELPQPVQNMIVRLYRDGPTAKGLFRVSANARLLREVKERLDTGKEVDMLVEVPILAVGATFKDYLRNMPASVFPVKMYQQFIETNDMADVAARQAAVKVLIEQLPPPNLALLRAVMPVLIRICDKQSENAMTPRNVGICIGQSLMCPPTTEDVLKNDVPPFIEFVVTNAAAIFGHLEPLPACKAAAAELAEGYVDILDAASGRGADDDDEALKSLSRATSEPSLADLSVASEGGLEGGSLPTHGTLARIGGLATRSTTDPLHSVTGSGCGHDPSSRAASAPGTADPADAASGGESATTQSRSGSGASSGGGSDDLEGFNDGN
jgi:hypothetical protein